MSTNKTENYQLHAWVAGDDFLREEINENFSVIDEGLGLKCEIVLGSYKGNDSSGEYQDIELGFTPKMVIVWSEKGLCVQSGYNLSGIAMGPGGAPEAGQYVYTPIMVAEGGFRIRNYSPGTLNNANNRYFYMAVR